MPEQSRTRVAIVRNPRSGSAPELAALDQARRTAGLAAEIVDMPDGEIDPWLDRVATGREVLAAAGGDGTVSTVATAAVRLGLSLIHI